MLLVAELDLRQLQLALALDEGLVRSVDHDVADGRVGEQLFERAKAEKLVDQDLFEGELLAAIERDLQLGEHLADDRAEFLGELVLAERRGRFGVDALKEAREHLFLDAVDRSLEPFRFAAGLAAVAVLACRQAVHRRHVRAAGILLSAVEIGRQVGDGRELLGLVRNLRRGSCGAPGGLHRFGDTKLRTAVAAHAAALAECVHSIPFLRFPPRSGMVNKTQTFRKT